MRGDHSIGFTAAVFFEVELAFGGVIDWLDDLVQ